ncbi:hypothetical protein LOTGIDRAFT_159694 [Lottia gigantea]|uniref:SRCR domain-containing protein n=1 Tax=Lottia gigantea TaxID=225164 RepID=V4C5Q9_LOTGI|nr:hypothetical protein LOTGIDRAFT_159694 [Lottia gigantea]ESO96939.1 hypothetical protein LOTGIDRAFT_159694 [Lottia gigantea]
MKLMYNNSRDWISVTTYDCLGTDFDIIEPFPSSTSCDDFNALRYVIYYECNGNDADNEPCSSLFNAPKCVTEHLNDLQLNCNQEKVTMLLNQNRDSVFNRSTVKACEDKMAPLINGSCYGMSQAEYHNEVPPCFQSLRELKDETTSLNSTCRMYLEGTRCLERKANDGETCSASHISRVLMGQMEYAKSLGENGLSAMLFIYGSAEKIGRVAKCQEHMESLEKMVNICDDEEYISGTIFSNLCFYQPKQGQNQCSITLADLLQCTIRTVQRLDSNCTATKIEQAVIGKINETNSNITVCDNEEYCSSALVKKEDILVCLRFLSFINYTDITVEDTCEFYGEGLECMSYYLRYLEVFCQPGTLSIPTANYLLDNKLSEFDFSVCEDNLTLEVVPSTRPLCDNEEALLKYTTSTCVQPVLNDVSEMPDSLCTLLTHISFCVVKTLHESVIYCTPRDVATVLIENAEFVQAKYPSLNFTGCSVPDFNVSVETTTPSAIVNTTCKWDDITESIPKSCPGEIMDVNSTHIDGKCEKLSQLYGCIQSSLETRGIPCPMSLVYELFKDHGDGVMPYVGINPRSCSGVEPMNKTCSAVNQLVIDPNAPEYVLKCFSLVFVSLSDDIDYDNACRLLAMAMRCAIKKSKMLGYDCTTDNIRPAVYSYTSLVFKSFNFDPDNCTAPIETRSICEAGDLMVLIASSSPCTYYANLNDQPACQSLSMLVDCVSTRISTSGMFCSKSTILEYLVDNIDMFELNSTFNFTTCLEKDVVEIPPTNLINCSVLPAADVSTLDTCQASIKEFQEAVNGSVKCSILFDVMRCVASSSFYMGYNCSINDITRLYGSSVLQGFNPENCDIPSEHDVPRGDNLCTDGAVFEYFITYDCKEYIPDPHRIGFCGSLMGMANCLDGLLKVCPKYEINKMIQAQPFMMYIGSIDDCKDEITTTPSPHYTSTTPYRNTTICAWESILDTASTICPDQMLKLAQNDSEKCPKLTSLAQCIHIAMVARDIECSMSTFLQLTYQNADYMRQTFNVEVQACLDDNQLLYPPLYVVDRGSLCSSPVVYDFVSNVTCKDSVKDCNLATYMECLANNITRLTNSECSMQNFTPNLAVDTFLQTYFSKCSNDTSDLLSNGCINPLSTADMTSISPCLTPIILMNDGASCSIYAQSLKCMTTKLGMNCTIKILHRYIQTVFNIVGHISGNMTQMSAIPRVAEICNNFVSNLTVDTIPDICQHGDAMINMIKRLPCIPQSVRNISTPCLYLVPTIRQCIQLASNMTGCKAEDIVQIITTNTEHLNDFIPIPVLEKCLGNGTFEENCPIILPNQYNTNIRSCLTLSITARATPNPVSTEDVCRMDSVAVKCVKEKGRIVGYDCQTKSIVQLIDRTADITVDEIEGSICDQSDIMVILATSYRCSMTYFNLQSESMCSLLDKMTRCVSRLLLESGMYCDNIKIKEGLISQTRRLQPYFNQTKQSTMNESSCILATDEVSYYPVNMTECSEMVVSGFDMCQHALMSLNQTQGTEQQCRVLEDSMKCLVYASQLSGYNCTADDLKEMYINNNTMLSTVYDTFSQSCSGPMEIPRLTSTSLCNTPFMYHYMIQYICSQFIPGNSDRMPCSVIQDLGSCIKSALSTEFQMTCPSYLIEGHLQRQPFMTYIGSVSVCSNQSSGNLQSGCEGVSVNSWHFTDCNQHYTMINQEPEKSCLHWEKTIHCVQTNVYNDGKYRYCKTKDVLGSLVNGIELGKILPNFDPEPCTKEMYENLPEDSCDEMMLYSLAMNKCDPKNNICGQEASIKECVLSDLYSHRSGCEDKIDEKLWYLISRNNQNCSEDQYSIDSRNQVYIFQNKTTSFICGLDWNDTDAEVLCKQLGYSYGVGKSDTEFEENSGFTYNCTGNESRLEDCPKHFNRDCFFQNKVAKAFCYNDDIQYGLIDGQSANEGRVTVVRNGVKGYLCSGYYTTYETNSVCRKLGFAGGDDLDDGQILTKSLDKLWKNTITCPDSSIDFAGCARKPWDVNPLPENESNYCYKSMAVYCHNKTRLNTADRNNTGMLMMYGERNGQTRLSPVCKDNINQDLVTAQCQYLGFNDGGELLDVNPFVSTFSSFGVKINSCPPTANTIEDCDIGYDQMCTQGPAILHCFINQANHSDGDMKIDTTGRIWVYKYDLWGTICSEGWNDKAARSFCRSQGYDSGVSRELSYLSYNAIDTKWLYNVSCFGNETGFWNCAHKYPTNDEYNVCRYADDAGAYCFNQSDNPYFILRDGVPHTPGSLPDYGRLYFSVKGEEGALCAPRNVQLPRVICKQQGFDYGEYFEGDLPSPRTSISWRGDLRCRDGDSMVLMCFEDGVNWIRVDSTSPSEISCDGHNTVQVYCYSDAWISTGFLNTTGMITVVDKTEQPIVLCENQINREGLNVFCKSTKKSAAQKISFMQYPGYHATGSIGYNCSGGELYLSRCQINTDVQCEGRPVVVRCDDDYDSGSIKDLVMDRDSGRLRLLKYGVYGSMCADQWTDVEADVFCRSKGYIKGYAKTLISNSRVAQFHSFKCYGSETSLLDCNYLNSPTKTCNDAAVKCITETDDFVISLENQNEFEGYGKILISRSGVTSYFCDTGYLSSADVENICRHLGFAESEVLDVDTKDQQTSVWEVDFECNSQNLSLYGCINSDWKYESWNASEINPSRCRYDIPQIRCSKPVNGIKLPDLNTRCENDTIYEMVDKDCDDVIDNITAEVRTSQKSACQFFPELVQCLAENLISKDIYCTEGQVFSALRQNKPEIMSIIGGLNTDNCDGMTFTPNADCASLPLFSQLLPQCFNIPNEIITDPTEIAKLCSQGRELLGCLAVKTREVGYLCQADDFMTLMAENQHYMTQKLRFDVSFCIQNPTQQTTQGTVMSTLSSDVHTRCLNSSIYDMVDKDCDDVIDNITMELQTSQVSACPYFPELVRCLSEKLISRNIFCSEIQVFTTLRQNQPEITSIIGGLNTDNCDGMTFVPKDACSSLPLYGKLLPQCYDAPNTMITDPQQIAQQCAKGYEMGQCLLKNIVDLGYTGCTVDMILASFMQNPEWAQTKLKFDIAQCQQPPK